ncbi:MAG: ferritin family protein [Betaproteobacteria bacterium]|nr:ferritin family protein [Betaproteobacteria bacterium]
MAPARSIRSPEELYAHAIAIEREAAERYSEFAERMSGLGNDAAARVFSTLAGFEAEHLETLKRRTDGIAVPELWPAEYKWLDTGAPETAAHDLVFRLITPYQALAIALDAEKRAQQFFEYVFRTSCDPALHALAQEMAAEESEHIAIVSEELARTPDPTVNWNSPYGEEATVAG